MSWTNQCTESNECEFKNAKEVKEVLEKMGFDVYEKDGFIQFYGGSDEWFDESTEVVLALEPIEVEGEKKNFIGLISDNICDSIELDSLEEEYGLKEGQYIVQEIIDYLQENLLENGYLTIKCAGFEERRSGAYSPYGDITVITKNNVNFSSLYHAEQKILQEFGIKTV